MAATSTASDPPATKRASSLVASRRIAATPSARVVREVSMHPRADATAVSRPPEIEQGKMRELVGWLRAFAAHGAAGPPPAHNRVEVSGSSDLASSHECVIDDRVELI
jgi:hypothetical protein